MIDRTSFGEHDATSGSWERPKTPWTRSSKRPLAIHPSDEGVPQSALETSHLLHPRPTRLRCRSQRQERRDRVQSSIVIILRGVRLRTNRAGFTAAACRPGPMNTRPPIPSPLPQPRRATQPERATHRKSRSLVRTGFDGTTQKTGISLGERHHPCL